MKFTQLDNDVLKNFKIKKKISPEMAKNSIFLFGNSKLNLTNSIIF